MSESHSRRRNKKKKKEIEQLRHEEYEDERRNLLSGIDLPVTSSEGVEEDFDAPDPERSYVFDPEQEDSAETQNPSSWTNFLLFGGAQGGGQSGQGEVEDVFEGAQEPDDFVEVAQPQPKAEQWKPPPAPPTPPPTKSPKKGKHRSQGGRHSEEPQSKPTPPPKIQKIEDADDLEDFEEHVSGSLWAKVVFFLLLLLLGGLATVVLVNNNDGESGIQEFPDPDNYEDHHEHVVDPSEGHGGHDEGMETPHLPEEGPDEDAFIANLVGVKDYLVNQYETIWPGGEEGQADGHEGQEGQEPQEDHQEPPPEPIDISEPVPQEQETQEEWFPEPEVEESQIEPPPTNWEDDSQGRTPSEEPSEGHGSIPQEEGDVHEEPGGIWAEPEQMVPDVEVPEVAEEDPETPGSWSWFEEVEDSHHNDEDSQHYQEEGETVTEREEQEVKAHPDQEDSIWGLEEDHIF